MIATADKPDADRLFADNQGLAFMCVNRFARGRHRTLMDRDDMEQVALETLWRAAKMYDPSRGYAFSTYACRAMLNELRSRARAPRWRPQARAFAYSLCVCRHAPDRTDLLLLDDVRHAMDVLDAESPRLATVIRLRVMTDERLTLEATGARLGVTKERARQMQVQALARLAKLVEGVA